LKFFTNQIALRNLHGNKQSCNLFELYVFLELTAMVKSTLGSRVIEQILESIEGEIISYI
jgi:hypothetical protein